MNTESTTHTNDYVRQRAKFGARSKAGDDRYVKKGWLSRGKGGPFPMLKTVYACPGFDFAASRERYVEAAMAAYEIEKRLRASGYFDPRSPNYGIDLAEQKG